MSRVGKRILAIPEGVEVNVTGNLVTVKGPKGELKQEALKDITVEVKDNEVHTTRPNDLRQTKMNHGTTNSLINNMIIGVTEGYEKELEIMGVGYMVQQSGTTLTFSLGLSHKVVVEVPEGLTAEVPSNTELKISGIDKQQVGEFAAKIKAYRKPEPYGGKGIRYKGEYIRRKAGKTAA